MSRPAAGLNGIPLALVLLSGLAIGAAGETLPPLRPAEWPRTAPQNPPPSSRPAAPEIPAPATTPTPAPAPACLSRLKERHGPDIRAVTLPAGEAGCAVVEPVELSAITLRVGERGARGRVEIRPPVTLACDMAAAVAAWVETSVQPLARGHYGRDLALLRVGGGHECRRRNRSADGPLSEHATGRALDVFAFEVGSGAERLSMEMAKPAGHESFLTALRNSACGAFVTALGPGSDATHADHLHVDIQARRASGRFCQ